MKVPLWILHRFFDSYDRLNFFTKNQDVPASNLIHTFTTPKAILDKEKEIYAGWLKRLADYNIDGEKLLSSPKGSMLYLTYIGEKQHNQAVFDKCRSCLKYVMSKNFTGCPIHAEIPMSCKDFADSEIDFMSRLADAVNRCSTCNHFKGLDEIELDCELSHNIFDMDCDSLSINTALI